MQVTADLNATADHNQKTVYTILFSIAFGHLLNDLMQAVIPATYPILKQSYSLSFTQIGLITFTFQVMASFLQPFVGFYTDKKPKPYSLAFAMLFTFTGLVSLSFADTFWMILVAVGLVGVGSSIFHPEASRVSYLASGGKRGLAQSIFQIGGNLGTAIGPLLVALLIVPYGQRYIVLFTLAAVIAIFVLRQIAKWYQNHIDSGSIKKVVREQFHHLSKWKVNMSVGILMVLIVPKATEIKNKNKWYCAS